MKIKLGLTNWDSIEFQLFLIKEFYHRHPELNYLKGKLEKAFMAAMRERGGIIKETVPLSESENNRMEIQMQIRIKLCNYLEF